MSTTNDWPRSRSGTCTTCATARAIDDKGSTNTSTRPTPVSIGERRKPNPAGRPGFIRIDTVHQGDLDGVKGVYHINAVDEVTQWQVVGAAAHISEA